MRVLLISSVAVLFAAVPCVAQTKAEKQALELVRRPPTILEPAIRVTGDEMDPTIKVSTEGVTQFVSKGLLASTVSENSFLRAFIDRKTGKISAQVYHRASSYGRGAARFRRATYETASGIREVEADVVSYDPSCSRYGCTHYEDVVFDIDFDVLKAAAAAFDAANPLVGLKYRLFAQAGNNIDEALPGNEIAAFVAVVQRQAASIRAQ